MKRYIIKITMNDGTIAYSKIKGMFSRKDSFTKNINDAFLLSIHMNPKQKVIEWGRMKDAYKQNISQGKRVDHLEQKIDGVVVALCDISKFEVVEVEVQTTIKVL